MPDFFVIKLCVQGASQGAYKSTQFSGIVFS